MEAILRAKGICKNYKSKNVLNGVNRTINKGDIYGFIVKNGAGKTTLIRILSGLTDAGGGIFEFSRVNSDSGDIGKAKKKVCTWMESPALYLDRPAKDNLKRQCLITGKSFKCIDELLSFVDLSNTGKKPVTFR